MTQSWQQAAEASLGVNIKSKTRLSGGDFATAYKVRFSNGDLAFIKTHTNPPANFFSTEAAGLSWLRATSTVSIPEVLAHSDTPPFLALEWIETGRASAKTDEALGVALAGLHGSALPHFGRSDSRTTGSLAVPNNPVQQWSEFYSQQRLLPLAKIALERQSLSAADCDSLVRVAENLSALAAEPEPPSLLHGDLWGGNRLVDSAGVSWLIDPAAHGGHREFDLAMMQLFGGYSDRCFAAYHEARPLQPGSEQRVALHQLAPLVVHAIKFGGSYRSAVRNAIQSSLPLVI